MSVKVNKMEIPRNRFRCPFLRNDIVHTYCEILTRANNCKTRCSEDEEKTELPEWCPIEEI